jgi:hypothetical protein
VNLAKHARREIVNKRDISTGEIDGDDDDDIFPRADDMEDCEDVSDEDDGAQFQHPNTSGGYLPSVLVNVETGRSIDTPNKRACSSDRSVGSIGKYHVASTEKTKRFKK